MKLEVAVRTLRLARPLHASYGSVRERDLLSVTLTFVTGVGPLVVVSAFTFSFLCVMEWGRGSTRSPGSWLC